MVCTKETYTATGTWTASQLAQLFEDAFIDAGLMASWYDSFANGGIENRVLEVTYDGAKTYGKTYYWFMFTSTGSSGVYLHLATGWDAPNNVPSGTQYLDYFSTTTNSTSNHLQTLAAGPSSTVELVRYTSGVDADQSWFVLKSGATRTVFTIVNDAMTIQPWINLSKGFYNGYAYSQLFTYQTQGLAQWSTGPALRRDVVMGCGLVGSTTNTNYRSHASEDLMGYRAVGHLSNSISNYEYEYPYIFLPVGFSGTNPAYTSNSSPIFHSLTWNPYITESLPADFGITFHYATNSFSQGDTFVVSAGTEEWEVLDFATNSSAITGASPLFLARMV